MTARSTIALLCASIAALASTAPARAQDVWVTMYFAAWTHQVDGSGGWVRTSDVDWDAFTQMNYFSLAAQGDGSVCCTSAGGNMSPARVGEIVAAAHAHGKPILVSVGGWGNYDGFHGAISPSSRARFVSTLVDYMTTWGFDGIDVDMEPINPGDRDNYVAFMRDLRTAMDAHTSAILTRPRLTAAVHWEPDLYAASQVGGILDQINIMTYDLAGVWMTQSWHNTALHGPASVATVDSEVARFRAGGVAPAKLGIGIDFYSYTWQGGRRSDDSANGITAPQQTWSGARPAITDNVAFRDIADRWGLTGDGSTSPYYRWDPVGGAGFLSIDQDGSSNDWFITYDDSRSIHDKLDYVRTNGYGGVIIWELGGGFRNGSTGTDRSPLTDALRDAMEEGLPPPPVDAGTPARDAGVAPHDAGTPPRDAGSTPHDAGSPPRDAGSTALDAGTEPHDAGAPTDDAGLVTHAPGESPDWSQHPDPPEDGGGPQHMHVAAGGGGCSASAHVESHGAAPFLMAALAAWLWRRKRH